MKTLICLFLFFFLLFNTTSAQQEHQVVINAQVESVTVFLNGAEIRQVDAVKLKKGKNRIIYKDITKDLRPSNIEVSIKEPVEILSVSSETDFLGAYNPDPKAAQWKDSADNINQQLTAINNEIEAYNAEKSVLKSNQAIGGNQPVSLAELQRLAEFHRTRTLQISKITSELSLRARSLRTKLALFEKQLQALNFKDNPERNNIVVLLSSAQDQQVQVQLRYITGNAGWAPKYDITAKDISSPVELRYKANISNNTGVSWQQVRLKLSTADPALGASAPTLNPWGLHYNADSREGFFDTRAVGKKAYEGVNVEKAPKMIAVDELSMEFVIERPYDIPADGKPYTVDVAHHSLNASFRHLAIPKLDKDAFLMARIGGWEKLNLIDGPADIYFGDTYVGESEINTRTVDDSLEISMGRDNQVLITRAKREDYSSKRFIGTNRTESFVYEIVVKNNRKTPVTIDVQDQLPLSYESDISVEAIEVSKATLEQQTGKLSWIETLAPGESVKYILAYSIKYPKNRIVNTRVMRLTPRFL